MLKRLADAVTWLYVVFVFIPYAFFRYWWNLKVLGLDENEFQSYVTVLTTDSYHVRRKAGLWAKWFGEDEYIERLTYEGYSVGSFPIYPTYQWAKLRYPTGDK